VGESTELTQPKDVQQPPGGPAPRPDIAARVAHFVANHRGSFLALTILLTLASVALLVVFGRFASDVLDLLPSRFDSVRVFKQFDREFSQARELTFAVVDDSGTVDLDAFIDRFAEELRAEPWVERVLEKSPMESDGGARDVQRLAVPLLLNLPAEDFQKALGALKPEAIDARITRLRATLEAGSPKAEFELESDPLGLVAPALKPLAGSFSVEQTRPLASPDGHLRIVLALTRQHDLGARACQETMRKVAALRERVLSGWSGAKPQIHVTGRTAYVGELSLIMRSDVQSTSIGSIFFVGAMFWLGFRRFRPLLAMMVAMLLSCLVAVALGALIFGELNMITIGLCAILFGLGEDFGVMLYGIYQADRDEGHGHEHAIATALRHHGKGIIFGALTTAVAFLCLLLSESSGFMQLGVLVALGIVAAGALMMTVFFVLLTSKHRERKSRITRAVSSRFVETIWKRPAAWTIAATVLFVVASVFGFSPAGRLSFETNPKSLEPRGSLAGAALRLIQSRMPAAGAPVLAVIEEPDQESFHRAWVQAQAHWSKLVEDGTLKSVNSPAGFAVSPARQKANADVLKAIDFTSAKAALKTVADREGLSSAGLAPAFGLLDELARAAGGESQALDWRATLPAESPWWFVIDRFLGRSPQVGAAYLVPSQPLASFADKERLSRAISIPGVPMHFCGWRYMLTELTPWSQGKLVQLTVAMVVLNFMLLALLFRRVSSIAIVFVGLVFGVGGLVATLKLTGISLNLFNVLAFPLVLGVGVDYSIYLVLAMREKDPRRELGVIFKPVLLSGVTTVAGFASLVTAQNSALRGFGLVCALGVAWCLVATFFFILPVIVWRDRRA
jgi:uncharacterized protein